MTTVGRAALPLFLVCVLGCVPARDATGDRIPRPAGDAALVREPAGPAPSVDLADSEDGTLVTVDGKPLRKTHLADFFLRYHRDRSREALTQLVDTILVDAEGDHHGVAVPAEILGAAVGRMIEVRQADLAERTRGSVSWEAYLETSVGLSAQAYRTAVRELLEVSLRLDRLIRYEQLRTDRVDVRVVVLPTRKEAEEVIGKLRAGADVVTLAREVSLAPVAAPAPIAVEDLPEDLRQAILKLAPGSVSDPYRVEREGREVWQVYRLVRHLPARSARYADVAEEIEKGLLRRPRETWEYEEWARRARTRHRIRWAVR